MSYHQTLSHYHLPRIKDMGQIYWCHTIGHWGIFMASIFVPIYLLKNGYSFTDIFLYLFIKQAFATILQYPINKLFARIDVHLLLMFGQLSFIGFFVLLMTLLSKEWPLALIAFFWALHRTMYYSAFHYIFGLSRAKKHAGRQIAKLGSLIVIGNTMAPAVGGIIATAFGISYTYLLAVLLILLSVIPLARAPRTVPLTKLKFSFAHLKEMRRDAIANWFNGMVVMTEQNIWPLFVTIIVTSYAGIGMLSSVVAASSIAVMMYVGRKEETVGEKHFIKRGLATYSLTSIGRTIATTTMQVAGLNLFSGIGRALYTTAYMNRYYTNSDGAHRLGYITVMEASFSFGSAIYALVLLGLLAFFAPETVLAIGLGSMAIAVIGVRLMR